MTTPRSKRLQPEFRVVDDALREQTSESGAGRKPQYDALIEGKTVFFPADDATDAYALANRVRNAMEKRGKIATARQFMDGQERGILVWVTGDREVKP